MRRLFLLVIALLLPSVAWSATYYVCQTAAGDGSGDSYANCESVANHNSDTFAEDDIIYLCDTFTSSVIAPSSGTSDHPIVYRGDYAGHAGILNTTAMAGFNSNGKSYLSVNSVTSTSTGSYGFLDGSATALSSHNTYTNCSASGAFYNGFESWQSDYLTISGGTYHDNGSAGIYLEAIHTRTPSGTITNTVIDGVTIYDNVAYGIAVSADAGYKSLTSNNEIKNSTAYGNGNGIYCFLADGCYVHNCTAYSNTVVDQENYGIAAEAGDNTIIEYNTCYDNGGSGIEIWSSVANSAHNSRIRYNKIYNHSECGIRANGGYNNNLEISFNAIYGAYWGIVWGPSTGVSVHNNTSAYNTLGFAVAPNTSGTVFRNNIAAFNTENALNSPVTSTFTHDHNLYYQTSGTPVYYGGTGYALNQIVGSLEATALVVDPLLVSATDFHLQGASPAKAAGVNLGTGYTDFAGVSLPTPYGWPTGAYSYNSFGGGTASFSGSIQ